MKSFPHIFKTRHVLSCLMIGLLGLAYAEPPEKLNPRPIEPPKAAAKAQAYPFAAKVIEISAKSIKVSFPADPQKKPVVYRIQPKTKFIINGKPGERAAIKAGDMIRGVVVSTTPPPAYRADDDKKFEFKLLPIDKYPLKDIVIDDSCLDSLCIP